MSDDATIATNDDATTCKRSAVRLGYWKDPYIDYFIRASERKAPEINRGYYARVKGMQTLLKKFLEITEGSGQVVNLGSGFDTTYWNLRDEGLSCSAFVEVDFQSVTARKAYYIQHRKPLLDRLAEEDDEIKFNKTDLHAKTYHIVAADLRNTTQLEQKLFDCGLDPTVPTLFQAECVLVYLPVAASTGLLQWIADRYTSAVFVNYEQVNMGDRFGQIMIENLKSRGCVLHGVDHCRSLDSQKQRFLGTGWSSADAMDMMSVYRSLPQADVQRFTFPASLRELHEELFSHYAISWAACDPTGIGLSAVNMDVKVASPENTQQGNTEQSGNTQQGNTQQGGNTRPGGNTQQGNSQLGNTPPGNSQLGIFQSGNTHLGNPQTNGLGLEVNSSISPQLGNTESGNTLLGNPNVLTTHVGDIKKETLSLDLVKEALQK